MDQNDAIERIYPDLSRAAYHVALDWSGVIDADDALQAIVVRLLEKKYAVTVAEMDAPARRRTLAKIAEQIASEERVDYDHFTGNYHYSTGEVRRHLDNGALDEVGEGVDAAAGIVAPPVEHVDIRSAFRFVSKRNRTILLHRYVTGDFDGYSIDLTRAVDDLTHALNRQHRRNQVEHHGPGSRVALSNSAAHVITSSQYSGSYDPQLYKGEVR